MAETLRIPQCWVSASDGLGELLSAAQFSSGVSLLSDTAPPLLNIAVNGQSACREGKESSNGVNRQELLP
ncbi:hypothetical protein [Serratia sp. M24T3]|uniref:hypothetical protein n=1 Tax=Serratia sp. M24T3 TaxID=932213 RepID=UPI0012F4E836|nr:hypothetical protein [Serratia sp. M24T3]